MVSWYPYFDALHLELASGVSVPLFFLVHVLHYVLITSKFIQSKILCYFNWIVLAILGLSWCWEILFRYIWSFSLSRCLRKKFVQLMDNVSKWRSFINLYIERHKKKWRHHIIKTSGMVLNLHWGRLHRKCTVILNKIASNSIIVESATLARLNHARHNKR